MIHKRSKAREAFSSAKHQDEDDDLELEDHQGGSTRTHLPHPFAPRAPLHQGARERHHNQAAAAAGLIHPHGPRQVNQGQGRPRLVREFGMRLPTIPEESSPVCTLEDLPQGIQNNKAKVLLQNKIIVSLEWIPNTKLRNQTCQIVD